jgi:hypothetical protein
VTKEELEIDLFRCEEANYDGNFVAIAVQIKDDSVYHAGVLISSDEGTYLCHFDATSVHVEEPPKEEWYFYKVFSFIDPTLVNAFLAHCKVVQKESFPVFGAYYDGSYYDHTGTYFSKISRTEFMTCVGFCVNLIKGFLSHEHEVEVFHYKDWSTASLSPTYLNNFIKTLKLHNPDVDVNSLTDNIRRILPVEFISAAYLKKMPFRKAKITPISLIVDDILLNKVPVVR